MEVLAKKSCIRIIHRGQRAWKPLNSALCRQGRNFCAATRRRHYSGCIYELESIENIERRKIIQSLSFMCFISTVFQDSVAFADDFIETPSGLRYLDLKIGEGTQPSKGTICVVHWSGYTEGYQGKRIDNTSVRDEPLEFTLGKGQVIPAFEEAVSTMRVGGYRRIQVPGSRPELGYPLDRAERFINDDGKLFKYRIGPQPKEIGGQRALDFVLDNKVLNDFNRTLLFDLKLLSVRK